MNIREFLDSIASGGISPAEGERILQGYGFLEMGHQTIDVHRSSRTSAPEVVFALTKDLDQLRLAASEHVKREIPLLMTRIAPEHARALLGEFPGLEWIPTARILRRGRSMQSVAGTVAVISAGASDRATAEEAAETLAFLSIDVERAFDCGVAGLHRLFAASSRIARADVLIVVAGMDGALPSVVGGIFRQPVIAVPTSVGYGASFGGVSALLTMLNSCAPGVTVVNIDNGFGAAVAASAILRLRSRMLETERVPEAT